ncbi:MAG TPA: hypothetical protein VFK09_12555 [Gemmatimonadales bacterium]|nr:hypothetical protein [Gemmatimonadales bacterium]
MTRPLAAALALLAACAAPAPRGSGLAVRVEPGRDSTRLVLVAAAGIKINARIPPALETPAGLRRFHAERLTPDSAYFADPPVAWLPGRVRRVSGTLRASVCSPGEAVCRALVIPI